MNVICPHCGREIPVGEMISQINRARPSERRRAAVRKNAEKARAVANANYTPEKRAAAAKKRLETTTPEERRAAALKAWRTKRAKQAAQK